MASLKNIVSSLPELPGVYFFKDNTGKIIYIGKAKSLKKRVQSYFSRQLDAKTQVMVSKIADIEYKLAPTDMQAQVLEAALVKACQPHYNIDLKDDKSFPWVRISAEEFPAISVCRRKKLQGDDSALYFGPYTNAQALRLALKAVRKIFAFRTCKVLPKRVCLYGKIKLCPAPCVGAISRERYASVIKNIQMCLSSEYEALLRKLSADMRNFSKAKEYESAAKVRDEMIAINAISQNKSPSIFLNELEDLQNILKLEKLPQRIEAFDISNISGQLACGSMVIFYGGIADKNNYRRFRVKTVGGVDDYAMLAEVVQRRYARLKAEGAVLPDLILIDGGKGHLETARKEVEKLGLVNIPMISIAKEKENIYTVDKIQPLRLRSDSAALNLVRRIRDEAHRFALAYHHVLRRKKIIGR